MSQIHSVCAYLVSYNRPELVKQSVGALLSQTRAVDKIVIIDNDSNDETRRVLNELASPTVEVIFLPENSGGAGGFSLATRLFSGSQFDYALLLDDDCIAAPAMVEKLVDGAADHSLDVANALVLRSTDRAKIGVGLWPLSRDASFTRPFDSVADARAFAKTGVILGTLHPFNGTLVSRRVVETVGFIDARLFIWGDEDDYVQRIAAAGLRMGVLTDAELTHPPDTKLWRSVFWKFKFYYPKSRLAPIYFRNRGFLNRKMSFLSSSKMLVKISAAYLLSGQAALGLKCVAYYLNGLFNNYEREPNGNANQRLIERVYANLAKVSSLG